MQQLTHHAPVVGKVHTLWNTYWFLECTGTELTQRDIFGDANPSLEVLTRGSTKKGGADQGGICRGGSRGTSPSLDVTFPLTGLSENFPARERVIPVAGEILLNCSSDEFSRMSAVTAAVISQRCPKVFNFDICSSGSDKYSNGPIPCTSYYFFTLHVVVSTSFIFYIHS